MNEYNEMLQQIDRLFNFPPKTPIVTAQQFSTKELMEKIEDQHFQMLDLEEQNQHVQLSYKSLVEEKNKLQSQLEEHRKLEQERAFAVVSHNALENELKKFKNDCIVSEVNAQHYKDLAKQRDTTLQESLKIISDLRSKVKSFEDMANHLARKSIEITQENSELKEKAKAVEEIKNIFGDVKKELENSKLQYKDILNSHEENCKLLQALQKELRDKKETCTVLVDALQAILDLKPWKIFDAKSIAAGNIGFAITRNIFTTKKP